MKFVSVLIVLSCLLGNDRLIADSLDENGFVGVTASFDSQSADYPSPARSSSQAGLNDERIEFILEHALLHKGAHFTPAGTFSARVRYSAQGVPKLSRLRLIRNLLAGAEKEAFEELVESNGFYCIRLQSDVFHNTSSFVLASLPARCLVAAEMKDHLELHMGAGGAVLGVTCTPAADCSVPHPPLASPKQWVVSSSASFKAALRAPRLVSQLEEQEAAAALRPPGDSPLLGAQKPVIEKTLFQKYWIYLLPLGLVFLNALAAANQEAPGPAAAAASGGGGGGQRRR
eukprot:jgi/Mesen1/2484/ME000159S01609